MTDQDFAEKEYIPFIDPRGLSYEDWVKVGMAMKNIGMSVDAFDAWSSQDTSRYKAGECDRKWNSFQLGGSVTIATLGEMAKQGGWKGKEHRELEWGDEIGGGKIVEEEWLEPTDIPKPNDRPAKLDLIKYLQLLFNSDENVGYVTETWERDGKFMPTSGAYDRTAGELIEKLGNVKNIAEVIGDYNEQAGAWIRFNPLDGQGVFDKNITSYRYALVESDNIPIEKQYSIFKSLSLPIAVLVHSGKKSLHAIVKIHADSLNQYKERVNKLFEICNKNGLKVDKSNRNPSRLSRMPGVMRNGHKQYIIDSNIGMGSYEEWIEWVEEQNDDLPEIEEMTTNEDDIEEKSPELIQDILREGHKMLLSGPSKAGKSFLLMNLCICIAEGRKWLGHECHKGKVLYVNLELDEKSCKHRFLDAYKSMNISLNSSRNLSIWNLRGKSVPMDKLAPKLIRRAVKTGYSAIVIDPIYKVITGDENSADKMAAFCNQFDKVCNALECSVIYCHHHSKGSQGQKQASDRASGSGVFSRDPDAVLDIIELNINEDLRSTLLNNYIEPYVRDYLNENNDEWDISQDDMVVADRFIKEAQAYLNSDDMQFRSGVYDIRQKVENLTAWRIEGSLREFASLKPIKCFFDFPLHILDNNNLLIDAKAEGEEPPWMKDKKAKKKFNQKEKKEDLEVAFESCEKKGDITLESMAQVLGCSERTARRRITSSPLFKIRSGLIFKDSGKGFEDDNDEEIEVDEECDF